MKKPFSLLILCTITLVIQAQTFELGTPQLPILSTEIASMDVASADLDGDSLTDIVLAGEFSRNVVLFNKGNGIFEEDPQKLLPKKDAANPYPGEDSEDIGIADFDNDGDLDLFFVSEDTENHELLLNDGSGKFTQSDYDFISSEGNALAILDLNDDGWLDIIVGNKAQNHIYINDKDASFTFDLNRWPNNTESTQDFKLLDIDADGDMDIVEGIDNGTNNVMINTNGSFTDDSQRLPSITDTIETRKVVLGDANGDQHIDIYVCTVNFTGNANAQNRLYINDGNGHFSDETSTRLPEMEDQGLDATFIDFDLDGDLDIVSVGAFAIGNNYKALENENGVFTAVTDSIFPAAFSMNDGIAIQQDDFNQDGYPDLYFGGFNETDDLLLFNHPNAPSGLTFLNVYQVSAYPNPTSAVLELKGNFPAIESITISDANGRCQQALWQSTANGIRLNVNDLTKGTYTLNMVYKKGLAVARFIKE